MEGQSGLSELSVTSWVSAIQGCPLSGVPLYMHGCRQWGSRGGFCPHPGFQPTIYIHIIKYYLNGAVLVTMKELNFTKDVLKYRPVLALPLDLDIVYCAKYVN